MRIYKAGKLPTEQSVDAQDRIFFKMKDLARNTIGINHIAAALDEDIAWQRFE